MGLPDEKPEDPTRMIILALTKGEGKQPMTVDEFIAANKKEYGSAIFIKTVANVNADDMERMMDFEFSHALKSMD